LQVWVYPKGSGSIADSIGALVYEVVTEEGAYKGYVGKYKHGTGVTLTATPASGYVFDHWGGDVTGESSSVIVHMIGNRYIEAYFSED